MKVQRISDSPSLIHLFRIRQTLCRVIPFILKIKMILLSCDVNLYMHPDVRHQKARFTKYVQLEIGQPQCVYLKV